MTVYEFLKRMQLHCRQEEEKNGGQANCHNCCFHAFCSAKPTEMTEKLIHDTLSRLSDSVLIDEKPLKEFYGKLKQHCAQELKKNGKCTYEQCCFEKLCYTPPVSLTNNVVVRSLLNLEQVQSAADL